MDVSQVKRLQIVLLAWFPPLLNSFILVKIFKLLVRLGVIEILMFLPGLLDDSLYLLYSEFCFG